MKCPKCGEKMVICDLGGFACPICDCPECPFLEFCQEVEDC